MKTPAGMKELDINARPRTALIASAMPGERGFALHPAMTNLQHAP